MKLLSIDPGITTGYVLFSDIETLEIEVSGDVFDENIEEWIRQISSCLRDGDRIVIERIPFPSLGELDTRLRHVLFALQNQFPSATHVLPGAWKPVTRRVEVPRNISKHQRDAYRLGWYFSKRMNYDK